MLVIRSKKPHKRKLTLIIIIAKSRVIVCKSIERKACSREIDPAKISIAVPTRTIVARFIRKTGYLPMATPIRITVIAINEKIDNNDIGLLYSSGLLKTKIFAESLFGLKDPLSNEEK